MFFKAALLSGLTALCLAPIATAQIESEGMGDLSAWGTRYLSSSEKEFPTRLWSGSDDESLLKLLKSVRTNRLTPSERSLLRRVVLSPTERPRGENAEALLAERARLMLELGEARAAAALAPHLESKARGLDAETIAVDLEMASGQEASACRRVAGPLPEGKYWLKLRVVCAILQENYAGAELAVEFATTQGVNDPWFIEAVFAASGDVPSPPNARFDTGLNIALSSKANLDTSRVTMSGSRPDLAAAAAKRPGVPTELRARFAQIAAEIDLISAEDRRKIILDRLSDEDATASTAIEQALVSLADPEIPAGLKAQRLNSVLSTVSRADMVRYGGTAKLFLPDLKRLQRSPETAQYALSFAHAALAAGDGALARRWLSALEFEGAPEAEPFDIALLEAADLITGGDKSSASQRAVQARLIEAADTTARKNRAAEMLTFWTGFGLPLGPDARALLNESSDPRSRAKPGSLTALEAAARSGAIGETALLVLSQTKGEPSKLAAADLAVLLRTLRTIGAEDIAADLALEASEFWKP